MRIIRLLAATLIGVATSVSTGAQTPSVPSATATARPSENAVKTNLTEDITDIWWPNAESGWGIQFVQNRGTVFATMYVYNAASQPTFYVAVLDNVPPGSPTFSGPLSATTGPYFGGPFDPAAVVENVVGTMTFQLTNPGTGTLFYNVGPTAVTKTINRQPLALEDNDGEYSFFWKGTSSSGPCVPSDVPTMGASIAIDQTGAAATITLTGFRDSVVTQCGLFASYSQVGRIGRYQGTVACVNGRVGQLTLSGVLNRIDMLTGAWDLTWDSGCRLQGTFAALGAEL
ncbi:MAG: hypothetical protein U1F51_19975 [Burkholderiales bacterium]